MQHWLLVRGRGDRPLAAQVVKSEITAHSSSKRPSVQRGDLAILYAAVWQAVFAVVEVVGDPANDPERTRLGLALRDPAARRRPRPSRRPAGRSGRHLPAVAMAPLPHPAVTGAVRD